jgi:hypothetical protein
LQRLRGLEQPQQPQQQLWLSQLQLWLSQLLPQQRKSWVGPQAVLLLPLLCRS